MRAAAVLIGSATALKVSSPFDVLKENLDKLNRETQAAQSDTNAQCERAQGDYRNVISETTAEINNQQNSLDVALGEQQSFASRSANLLQNVGQLKAQNSLLSKDTKASQGAHNIEHTASVASLAELDTAIKQGEIVCAQFSSQIDEHSQSSDAITTIATTCNQFLEQLQEQRREENHKDAQNTNNLASLLSKLNSEITSNKNMAVSKDEDAKKSAKSAGAAKSEAAQAEKVLANLEKVLKTAEIDLQKEIDHCSERDEEFTATLKGIAEFKMHLKDGGMETLLQVGTSLLQADVSSSLRARAVTMLSSKKSATLKKIASQVAVAGPFDNVVDIINNAIVTLKDQVANAMSKNEHCKKNLAENEVARNDNTAAVRKHRVQFFESKGRLANAKQQEVDAQKNLERSTKQLAEFSETREASKAANTATTEKYTTAEEAFKKGVAALQKNGVSRSSAEALYGAIDIIQADIAGILHETKQAEKSEAAQFDEHQKQAKALDISLTEEIENSHMTQQQGNQEIVEVQDSHTNAMEMLESSMKQFEAIKTQCLTSGEGFQDRNAKRQEEIDSLKEALEILDKNTQ